MLAPNIPSRQTAAPIYELSVLNKFYLQLQLFELDIDWTYWNMESITEKGKPCLVFQNNRFRFVYKGLESTAWRCTKKACKAQIHFWVFKHNLQAARRKLCEIAGYVCNSSNERYGCRQETVTSWQLHQVLWSISQSTRSCVCVCVAVMSQCICHSYVNKVLLSKQ